MQDPRGQAAVAALGPIPYAEGYNLSWPLPVLCGETGSVSQVKATVKGAGSSDRWVGPSTARCHSPPHPKTGIVFV